MELEAVGSKPFPNIYPDHGEGIWALEDTDPTDGRNIIEVGTLGHYRQGSVTLGSSVAVYMQVKTGGERQTSDKLSRVHGDFVPVPSTRGHRKDKDC